MGRAEIFLFKWKLCGDGSSEKLRAERMGSPVVFRKYKGKEKNGKGEKEKERLRWKKREREI